MYSRADLKKILHSFTPEQAEYFQRATPAERIRMAVEVARSKIGRQLSLRYLAKKASISHQTLSLITRGQTRQPSDGTIRGIADLFGVHESAFLTGKLEPSPARQRLYGHGLPADVNEFLRERDGIAHAIAGLRLARAAWDLDVPMEFVTGLQTLLKPLFDLVQDVSK